MYDYEKLAHGADLTLDVYLKNVSKQDLYAITEMKTLLTTSFILLVTACRNVFHNTSIAFSALPLGALQQAFAKTDHRATV